jgi:DivIVA domain-containing protein
MGADPSLSPELIQAQAFSSGFRGYDQSEVREFLGRVATEIRALRDRTDHLESAWHSAEERAARPPVLDEDTLMDAVGEETASILRAARSAAADLRTRAAQETERMIAEAEARAQEIRAEAEVVLARETTVAEQAASRIVESARSEAAQMVDKARAEGDATRAAAQHERTLTIEGAIATRERVLDDLARRRRVASVQIEQLRAGRERLLESYGVVRRTLEEVNDELNRADAEARAAADEVGRRMQRDYHPEAAAGEGEGPDDPAVTDPASDAVATEEPPASADVAPPTETAAESAAESGAGVPLGPPVPARSGGGKRRGPAVSPAGGEALAAALDQPQEAPTSAQPAAGPHLRVVPNPSASTTDTDAAPPGSQVDVLFARIRSGNVQTSVEAVAVAPEADVEPSVSSGDETLLQRREAAIEDLESSLTRKLKRTMQDEQNDLLDRLRSLRGEPTLARLLPDRPAQITRYAEVAQPLVDGAAAAGVAFAVETLDRKGRARASVPVVADLAAEAATTIVESLRRRLEHAISASAGDEQAVLVEAVGAAYREWKSERIERVAGDVLAAAFSRGTWHEVPDGTPLRWVVEDTDGPCPDCDDDVLAGNLPKGEAFPTGQPYPPAHPGCRCLLVPVTE